MPGNNNGSKKNELWMCSHIYDLIYKHRLPDHIITEIYKEEIDSEYLIANLPAWRENLSSYERIYDASKRADGNLFNQWFAEQGAYYPMFSYLPRTGIVAALYHVIFNPGEKLYISNFSFFDEIRISTYAKSNESFHKPQEEFRALRWLHNNSYVDCSLCMIQDMENPTIQINKKCKPSLEMLSLVSEIYGKYTLDITD